MHDTALQLVKVINPQGLAWRYEYDEVGNLISETDFDARIQTYAHDAAGRLIARTTALGGTIHFTMTRWAASPPRRSTAAHHIHLRPPGNDPGRRPGQRARLRP